MRASNAHDTPHSPLRAEIDLGALRRNVRRLRAHVAPAALAGTVKADAYGHGALPIARTMTEEGVDWLCVARLDEGVALREGGIGGHVLVLGTPFADEVATYAAHRLDATVTSEPVAAMLAAQARKAAQATGRPLRVHVKADTGMHRLGIAPEAVPDVLARLYAADGAKVAGLWTHFATADEAASPFAATQAERFASLRADLARAGVPAPPLLHVANSGAALLREPLQLPAGTAALARVGGLAYGLPSSPDLAAAADRLGLEPVMRLVARVVHVQTIAAGESVSYGQTWTASAPTRIATLAVGYGDGFPRSLSNVGEAAIHERRYPIAGRVCMDLTMLDLGLPGGAGAAVRVGDEAVLFGHGGPSALEVAERAGTISYAVTAGLTARVPRVYTGTR
ncbi:MAG: alanine racemase [Bacteroidota bacterium]